jgi:hypothetical protein|tara:strand:+ start:405 stop:686 length:282 start_codon:yes stop_codon:yes gene_type:complete
MNINKFYGMTGGVIVCNWCNGDHLGACSDASSKRGFTAYCFSCGAPCTTLEVAMSDASTLDATTRSALDVWRNAAMRDKVLSNYQLGSLGELI